MRRFRPVLWRSLAARRFWPRPRRTLLPRSPRGRLACALLAVVTGCAGLWGLVGSALLDVDHLEVTGALEVSVAQVIDTAGVDRGDPMFGLDVGAARSRLEAIPWVLHARVKRVFPNRLRIGLDERRLLAFARTGGGFALVDDTGRVLADRPEPPGGLPELIGAGTVPAAGKWWPAAKPALAVVVALPEPLRPQVTQATLVGDSITLRLGDREVRFGRPELLEAKTAALSVLLERLGSRRVAYLDVRVPSAPVVGPGGPAPAPAPPAPGAPVAPGPRD